MKKNRKKIGKHDWNGECVPGKGVYSPYTTFSVGIFQWVQGSGKLKRGKVKFRIKGSTSYPQPVYDAAEAWCDLMDKGTVPDFKTLNMGFSE